MADRVRVGLCGLGTVGSGVVALFQRGDGSFDARTGVRCELVHVGARRDRPGVDLSGCRVSRDIFEVARDPEVDILVELIGGIDTAKALVETALTAGKHVVTANKALIATHGNDLFAMATAHGVTLRFEAAVAGGIPVIKALREGLAANRIDAIAGIINGTGNFILTEMAAAGRPFAEVLAEAQALGYAEADPTFDVDGTDAAHKLVILAAIAFGTPLDIDAPLKTGIDTVEPADLRYAAELGYRIKHLGIARREGERIDLRVHPTLVPQHKSLATVDGVLNAVMLHGDAVGEILLIGPGAGALPTASAVCADIVDLARELARDQVCPIPALGVAAEALVARPLVPHADTESVWYLRLQAQDRPGVMAEIARLLGDEGISIETLIQKAPARGESSVPIVILTNRATAAAVERALSAIAGLAAAAGAAACLRVEDFNGGTS